MLSLPPAKMSASESNTGLVAQIHLTEDCCDDCRFSKTYVRLNNLLCNKTRVVSHFLYYTRHHEYIACN